MRKPNTTVVTRRDLIKDVCNDFQGHYDPAEIRNILDSLEFFIADKLMQATPGNPVQVRLFSGLYLNSQIIPAQRKNTVYADDVCIPEHLQVKARATRYYNQKLNIERKYI